MSCGRTVAATVRPLTGKKKGLGNSPWSFGFKQHDCSVGMAEKRRTPGRYGLRTPNPLLTPPAGTLSKLTGAVFSVSRTSDTAHSRAPSYVTNICHRFGAIAPKGT